MKFKIPFLNFFIQKSKLTCPTLSKELMSTKMDMPKRLAVFDFDSTICVYNSDNVIRNLLPKEVIQEYERGQQFSMTGWTKYMQGVFELLFSRQVDESKMTQAISEIPPIDGMPKLLKELVDLNFDNIIISDANSYFINKWLEQQSLTSYIKQVFTNPAQFENGCLKIEMYHVQRTCSLSTINLCKGQILEEFIEKQKNNGVNYNKIIYVGDGANDFCPILRLGNGDLACCRDGFPCAGIVKDVIEKKPYRNKLYEINANVMMWNNGHDILNSVRESIK